MAVNSPHLAGFIGPSLDPKTPIYRIYPQRFLENLLKGRLVIRSTRTWADPYEKLVAQCCYETLENGRIAQHFIEGNLLPTFGQCWSSCRESDAMWRIYSSVHQDGTKLDAGFDTGEAIRLRTTVGKLLNSLVAGAGTNKGGNCFIARVRYLEQEALAQEVANIIGSYRARAFSGNSGNADAFLFKRDSFAHESEIRLLYVDAEKQFEGEDQIEVPIDPNALIEELTIDPRVLGGNQETWRTNWIRGLGFRNEINRSLLYLGVALMVPLFTEEKLANLVEPGLRR